MDNDLAERIAASAIAFRGYNVKNLGRTPKLLAHRAYGPIVKQYLDQASEICAEATGRKTNLVARVRRRARSTLQSYTQDLAMIVGVELAQLELLKEFFGVCLTDARYLLGYSLGEVTALAAAGVYDVAAVLTPILTLARDAAALARDVNMGVLFSRGPALELDDVRRLCLQITNEGEGTIAVSSYLSPNTVLLLGQGRTVDRFRKTMHKVLPELVHLRPNPHHWPPMHTPITWQKNISNRAAVLLATQPGGFDPPIPPILSFVTGEDSYNDFNSRDILCRWIDHPQQVWGVINKVFAAGVETIIHVGPEPNILPATFNRLKNNVSAQLARNSLGGLGLRAVSRIVRRHRSWMSSLLSTDTTLLRAPFVDQIILEDWLLEQTVP